MAREIKSNWISKWPIFSIPTLFPKYCVHAHFLSILIGWVLFRATSIQGAFGLIADMHSFSGLPAAGEKALIIFGLTTVALLLMHLMDRYVLNSAEKLENRPWLFWPLLVIGQLLCLMIGEPSSEFIYFQF